MQVLKMIKWTWLLIFKIFNVVIFLLSNVHPPMKPHKPRSKPISKGIDVIYYDGCHLEIKKRKPMKSI